jgi:hypothetical protein
VKHYLARFLNYILTMGAVALEEYELMKDSKYRV